MFVENEKELGKALKNDEEEIELEGILAKKIKKIYQLDQAAWGLCLICLAIAVTTLLAAPAPSGISVAFTLAAETPAVAVIGLPSAVTAILAAAAGGGVGVLVKLRKRKMQQLKNGHIVLHLNKGNRR